MLEALPRALAYIELGSINLLVYFICHMPIIIILRLAWGSLMKGLKLPDSQKDIL